MPAVLDWRDASHFDRTGARPCRWCGKPTPLRDEQRKPAHKVCAEQRQPLAAAADSGTPAPATAARPAALSPREEPVPDLFTPPATGRRHPGRAA